MRLFADYRSEVKAAYNLKKSTGTLPSRLARPTPARLRQECIDVCRERFYRGDENTLRTFFGGTGDAKAHIKAIEQFDINKFKPLVGYLKKGNVTPADKNIELLAWLIDFADRPFDLNRGYRGDNQSTGDDEPQVSIDGSPNMIIDTQSASGQNPIVSSKKSKLKNKVLIIALIVTLFAGIVGYLNLNRATSADKINSNDSCMYWKDDHYERISCGQKVQYSKVIAFDPDLFNNFRKITLPDTITYHSISKVWYIKINGAPEFYTEMGYHPVSDHLQLKPITEYIIDKYIRKKTLLNDSVVNPLPNDNMAVRQADLTQLKTPASGIYGQCRAITKAKTRCARNAKPGGYCWQHRKQGT